MSPKTSDLTSSDVLLGHQSEILLKWKEHIEITVNFPDSMFVKKIYVLGVNPTVSSEAHVA
jgi:hypothetical protein